MPPETGTRLVISRCTPVGVLADLRHQLCGPDGEIALIQRDAQFLRGSRGVLEADRDARSGRTGGGDFLVERYRQVDAGHRVVAVAAGSSDAEGDIDFPGRLDPDGSGGAGNSARGS